MGSWIQSNAYLYNNDFVIYCEYYYYAVMDGNAPFYSAPLESDYSTGYLEDALVEFSEMSKRRRLLLYTDDHTDHDGPEELAKVINLFLSEFPYWGFNYCRLFWLIKSTRAFMLYAQSYWNSNCTWGMSENVYSLSQINTMNGLSGNYNIIVLAFFYLCSATQL